MSNPMSNPNESDIDIVRAWKDEEYRQSLSEEQRAKLPESPAGLMELSDEEIEQISGGLLSQRSGSCICCSC